MRDESYSSFRQQRPTIDHKAELIQSGLAALLERIKGYNDKTLALYRQFGQDFHGRNPAPGSITLHLRKDVYPLDLYWSFYLGPGNTSLAPNSSPAAGRYTNYRRIGIRLRMSDIRRGKMGARAEVLLRYDANVRDLRRERTRLVADLEGAARHLRKYAALDISDPA